MRTILLLIICLSPFVSDAQEFGCFDISQPRNGDNVLRSIYDYHSRVNTIDWKNYTVKNPVDGFYREEYGYSPYYPIHQKMEGTIANGLKTGPWTFYTADGIIYAKGNFIAGKKEGEWKAYQVNYFNDDTFCIFTAHFTNDSLDGKVTEYYRYGNIASATNYNMGLKHGTCTIYFEPGTFGPGSSYEPYVSSTTNYKSGLREGIRIEYSQPGDTLSYEVFANDKRNGRCRYYFYYGMGTERIIDFRNDSLAGTYQLYYSASKPAYTIECKNNLPWTSVIAIDKAGNKLDPGTLKNGNGTLLFYYNTGQLKSAFNYKNQLVSGAFAHYNEDGTLREEGIIHCNSDQHYKEGKTSLYIEDFNIFAVRQQNFSSGTDYKMYGKGGYISARIKSTDQGDTLLVKKFAANGTLIYEGQEIYGLKTGIEKEYYNNAQMMQTSEYTITDKDTIKEALKNGAFTYYHQNGLLKAEVFYAKGKEIDRSNYYDDSGNLKRIKINYPNGEVFNIFNGDTVNRIDAKGLKQGKWISFSDYISPQNCEEAPETIKYFCDGKPCGTWEYYNRFNKSLSEKYVWKDSVLAMKFIYSHEGRLSEEGLVIDEDFKTGEWKEYDYKKGFLKFKGEYIYDLKEGEWVEYRRNGKTKMILHYKRGKEDIER